MDGDLFPLLLVTGALLASALAKLRVASRAGVGVHRPSVAELVLGLVLAGVAVAGGLTVGGALWALVVGFLVLVASSLHLLGALRRRDERRERTEGRRLEAYVRYLSTHDDGTP